jgi:hypothetical protein
MLSCLGKLFTAILKVFIYSLITWSSPKALLFLSFFFIPLKISSFVMGEYIFTFNSAVIVVYKLRRGALDTALCDKVCQWLAAGWWFSTGFLHQENWPPRYNWNIVESGIKPHNSNYILVSYIIVKQHLLNIREHRQEKGKGQLYAKQQDY